MCVDDKYKLDNGVKPRAVADDLIYNSGNTFSIPMFLYKIAFGFKQFIQNILMSFIVRVMMVFFNFWETAGMSDMKIDDLMNYDPISWKNHGTLTKTDLTTSFFSYIMCKVSLQTTYDRND
jgi:hypothetical protein